MKKGCISRLVEINSDGALTNKYLKGRVSGTVAMILKKKCGNVSCGSNAPSELFSCKCDM